MEFERFEADLTKGSCVGIRGACGRAGKYLIPGIFFPIWGDILMGHRPTLPLTKTSGNSP